MVDPPITMISLMNKFEQCIFGLLMDTFIVKNNSHDTIFKLNYYQLLEGKLQK